MAGWADVQNTQFKKMVEQREGESDTLSESNE